MKKLFALLVVVTASLLVGCSSTPQTVVVHKYVAPVCQPSPEPSLEFVSVDELVGVSDETYEKLAINEKKLINWGKANRDILLKVCDTSSDDM